MSAEPITAAGRRLASYEELGARRHHLISERLRERRRALGLTQKEVVARLRRMGVATSNKALSALEHGSGLDVAKLPEIARALECSLTYLVGLTEDPRSWEPDFQHWPGPRPATPPQEAVPVPSARPSSQPPSAPSSPPACPPILGPLG